MSENARIYMPENGSLEERINVYRDILKAYRNSELSVELIQENEHDNTLGTADEVKYAQAVSKNSLEHSVKTFSASDLENIKKQKLLSDDELRELSIQRSKNKLKEFRQSKNKDNFQFKK